MAEAHFLLRLGKRLWIMTVYLLHRGSYEKTHVS